MHKIFKGIKAIGFDLDGTLYPTKGIIDNRIRTKISEKILEIKPELKDIENARKYFDEQYRILGSGTKVLRYSGYGANASKMMDWCLANADVIDLIKKNTELVNIFDNLNLKFITYLLTDSPQELSLSKLERIGLGQDNFDFMFFGGTLGVGVKSDGDVFDYVLEKICIPSKKHIYVGDRKKSDILPARERKMKTISVGSIIPEANLSIENINDLSKLL